MSGSLAGKRKTYTGTSPSHFSKKAMQWGKKWPVPTNLPFFAVEAYVPGRVQNQAEKNSKSAFWPAPVPKSTFPALGADGNGQRGSSPRSSPRFAETFRLRFPSRNGQENVSGLQKGPAERGHVKKRQKTSKSVKKFFDTFRQFSRRAKNVKNRQKVSKSFSTLFDNFHAAPFFRRPFCNPLKMLRIAEKFSEPFPSPTTRVVGRPGEEEGSITTEHWQRGWQPVFCQDLSGDPNPQCFLKSTAVQMSELFAIGPVQFIR